mgnify:FL=1
MNEKNILFQIDFLAKNLINKTEEEKPKAENSSKRELLIGQILKENFDLEINNEKELFQKERTNIFIEVIFSEYNEYNKLIEYYIKRKVYPKKSESITLQFEAMGRQYDIMIGQFCQLKVGTKFLKLYVNPASTKDSDIFSSNSSNSNKSNKGKILNNPIIPKIFEDIIDEKKYYIMIVQREHEIDGSFIAKEDICDLKGLNEIMFYPKKKEDIKILKGERIIVEVKQNATLLTLYKQMKKYIYDFTDVFASKNIHYFGFVKDSNYNVDEKNEKINEEKFKADIENDMSKFHDFKLYIFIIKNNELFNNPLNEQLEYGFHYFNIAKKEIKQIENRLGGVENKIDELEKKISGLDNRMSGLDNRMSGLENRMENLESKIENIENMLSNISFKRKKKFSTFNYGYERFNLKRNVNNNFRYRRGAYIHNNRGWAGINRARGRTINYYQKKFNYH